MVWTGHSTSTKAFSFHNRSSLNFAHRLVTILSTIAPCRSFKLSFFYLLLIINFQSANCLMQHQQQPAAAALLGHKTLPARAAPQRDCIDDTWRIEMKCAFPGPTATRCCSCCVRIVPGVGVTIVLFTRPHACTDTAGERQYSS